LEQTPDTTTEIQGLSSSYNSDGGNWICSELGRLQQVFNQLETQQIYDQQQQQLQGRQHRVYQELARVRKNGIQALMIEKCCPS